ncbi:hypothetical protein QO001_000102 [Methylobacterium brachiatum]|uniref:Uncharacterized protein n=2 Tax=Methylobacterium brachiatum TaxID=269660 RepID=A0AAJ1TLN9_9HYPH|nr:hypothetical protein [Methylobacterium brachiatum]MDQ0541194.1 hypothetical protein [Methylobacterium brachiatum]
MSPKIMIPHSARPRATTETTGARSLRDAAGSPYVPATGALLHGAAFVLLCLWTRTSPDRLRDQLDPGADSCSALGF